MKNTALVLKSFSPTITFKGVYRVWLARNCATVSWHRVIIKNSTTMFPSIEYKKLNGEALCRMTLRDLLKLNLKLIMTAAISAICFANEAKAARQWDGFVLRNIK